MVVGAILDLVALGSTREQAEVAMESKLVNRTPPQFLYQFLSPGFCPVRVPALTGFDDELLYGPLSKINPVLPNLLWSGCFITATVYIVFSNVFN